MKNLIFLSISIISTFSISACNKQSDPQPWNVTNYNDQNLTYYGNIYLSQTSENSFCQSKGGRIEIAGGFARNADSDLPRFRTFSTNPDVAQVTIPCREFEVKMELQQRVNAGSSGNITQWVSTTGGSVAVMDAACNITLEAGINVNFAHKRYLMTVTKWPQNNRSSNNLVSLPLTIECP